MHEKALIKESVLETIRFRSTLNYGRNAHEHENIVTTAWFLQLNVGTYVVLEDKLFWKMSFKKKPGCIRHYLGKKY